MNDLRSTNSFNGDRADLISLIARNSFCDDNSKMMVNDIEVRNFNEGLAHFNPNQYYKHLVFIDDKKIVDTNKNSNYIINNISKNLTSYIFLCSQKRAYEQIYDVADDEKIKKLLSISSKYRNFEVKGFKPFNYHIFDILKKQLRVDLLKDDMKNHAEICFYHNQAQKSNKQNRALVVLTVVLAVLTIVLVFLTVIQIVK